MTKLKDPIRQASLFTMGGLVDPRLMPDHLDIKSTVNEKQKETKHKAAPFSILRKVVEEIAGRKTGRAQV